MNKLYERCPTIDYEQLVQRCESESRKLFEACSGYGFFYLKYHKIEHEDIFDLADRVFELPLKEKLVYDMGTTGGYFGYKSSGATIVDEKGTADNCEFYNISKDDILHVGEPQNHPHPVYEYHRQLETFIKSSHWVCTVILSHIAVNLGLPETDLTNLHRLEVKSGDQVRLTCSSPTSQVQTETTIAIGEHTDFGSITILFNRSSGINAEYGEEKTSK
eukprot:TRINITY_DN19985_c0_g1_i1.p1 TRINITY_DN19985_c0_g1~~TRINITY_DN19985_c0_g1_i1.p1  ORF type:complete len:218 (+),score=41.30 TRINITY_DN19985_c0_g1_i1:154-807(+)